MIRTSKKHAVKVLYPSREAILRNWVPSFGSKGITKAMVCSTMFETVAEYEVADADFGEHLTDEQIANMAYTTLNSPFSVNSDLTKAVAAKAREGKTTHTSMSVGDVIKINDTFYVCDSYDWRKL